VWIDLVVTELGSMPGRVLHTECGNGSLLAAMSEAGADAYGVEPVDALAMDASRAGLDVRADDALTHLRALPEASLAGLVLSGCVDALPLGEVLEVADRAAATVAPGGRVVILSAGPAAWARALDPVVADLAPGRPLHPETWVHLLGERGFTGARVEARSETPALERVPADTPGAEALNANCERIERLLYSPAAYAVVASRA
jgi:O-antigen chain-terminating methyltransferase